MRWERPLIREVVPALASLVPTKLKPPPLPICKMKRRKRYQLNPPEKGDPLTAVGYFII